MPVPGNPRLARVAVATRPLFTKGQIMKGYTMYHPVVKKLAKDFNITLTGTAFLEYLAQELYAMYDSFQDDPASADQVKMYSDVLLLEWHVIEGTAHHVFMPNRQFCDWLVSCVPARLTHAYLNTLGHTMGLNTCYCIHFPVGSGLGSFVAMVDSARRQCIRLPEVDLTEAQANNRLRFTLHAGTDFIPEGAPDYRAITLDEGATDAIDVSDDGSRLEYCVHLMVALGLYLDCFPEQLKQGLPAGLKLGPQDNIHSAHSIGVADAVRDTAPHNSGWTATPHYRSGHFRLLKADRYVNKKGMTVFVKPCFVHGKAETVQDLEGRPCTTMEAVYV